MHSITGRLINNATDRKITFTNYKISDEEFEEENFVKITIMKKAMEENNIPPEFIVLLGSPDNWKLEIDKDEFDETESKVIKDSKAFEKIVLPEGYEEKIIETISQIKYHDKLFKEWGFGETIKKGKGVNILFTGKSGTGKTYCGELIAEYLGYKCELVSSATLESKYVGESEKNLNNLLNSNRSKVVVIDEADSFLNSRADSRNQTHENKLTNQFLIELERHNGIVILTTNKGISLDKAVARRIDLILEFPDPDEQGRIKIWQRHIPKKFPCEKIDWNKIGKFEINGGRIKNIILSAARKMIARNIKKLNEKLLVECINDDIDSEDALKKTFA